LSGFRCVEMGSWSKGKTVIQEQERIVPAAILPLVDSSMGPSVTR